MPEKKKEAPKKSEVPEVKDPETPHAGPMINMERGVENEGMPSSPEEGKRVTFTAKRDRKEPEQIPKKAPVPADAKNYVDDILALPNAEHTCLECEHWLCDKSNIEKGSLHLSMDGLMGMCRCYPPGKAGLVKYPYTLSDTPSCGQFKKRKESD